MGCAERNALVRLCETYVREYTEAVRQLGGLSFRLAKDDWQLAYELAERARLKSAEVLEKLRRHSEEHGC
jgi:hypothetical protein